MEDNANNANIPSAPTTPTMPNSANMSAPLPAPKAASSGAIWAIAIILAVILAGGAYFWSERDMGNDENLDAINTQSESDETAAIEADLDSTDVENVDADLSAS